LVYSLREVRVHSGNLMNTDNIAVANPKGINAKNISLKDRKSSKNDSRLGSIIKLKINAKV
jgi:hypothetical protein